MQKIRKKHQVFFHELRVKIGKNAQETDPFQCLEVAMEWIADSEPSSDEASSERKKIGEKGNSAIFFQTMFISDITTN